MRVFREKAAGVCDEVCLWTGALTPVGIVVGNVGFESMVSLCGLAWLVRSLFQWKSPFEFVTRHPLFLPWLFWFSTILISLMANGAGSKGCGHDIAFVRFLLFGIALLDVSDRRPVGRYLARGLGAAVVLAVLNTVFAYAAGHDMLGKPLSRYQGKLKEAARYSGLGAYASVFFAAWAFGDREKKAGSRAMLFVLAALAFAQVVQTQVRTVVLAVLAGYGFIFVYGQARRFGLKKTALACSGAGVVLGIAFWKGEWWNMESMYDRWAIWQVSWEVWKEHPFIGVGVSSFQDAFARVSASGIVPPFEAPDGRVYFNAEQMHAHNLFLMLGCCTGIFGLASFLWLFVRSSMMSFAKPAGWRFGLAAWPVVLLVIGLTGFNIFHSWYNALVAFFFVLAGAREIR